MQNLRNRTTGIVCWALVGLGGACRSVEPTPSMRGGEAGETSREGGAPNGGALGGSSDSADAQAGEPPTLGTGGQDAARAGAPSVQPPGAGGLPGGEGGIDAGGQAAAGAPASLACSPGEYVIEAANETTRCAACPPGTYSSQANSQQCTEWRRCRWSEVELASSATASSDRTCVTRSAFWQFGTSEQDVAQSVAVDADGNVLVADYTGGDLHGTSAGGEDAFVRKFGDAGGELWTHQFGTSAADVALAVATDVAGNVYVAGATFGPLEGTNAGSRDGFVRKLGPSGNLLWTRQFGTNGEDFALSVAVDPASNVYVAGYVASAPGSGSDTSDAFVRKLDGEGQVLWDRVFGTGATDSAHAVAVDVAGDVYVAGRTAGSLASANAGAVDAFVRKLTSAGDVLWTHQLGTGRDDEAAAVAVDPAGQVYISGTTLGSLQRQLQGEMDVFVRKLATTGAVEWTQQLGTSDTDIGLALAVDVTGNVFVGGYTAGSIEGSNAGGVDGFVRELDTTGLELGTFQFGTPENELPYAFATDGEGQLYAAGFTGGALQGSNAGSADVLVMKLTIPP